MSVGTANTGFTEGTEYAMRTTRFSRHATERSVQRNVDHKQVCKILTRGTKTDAGDGLTCYGDPGGSRVIASSKRKTVVTVLPPEPVAGSGIRNLESGHSRPRLMTNNTFTTVETGGSPT